MEELEADDESSNGKKYHINCHKLLESNNYSTKEWLSSIQLLDTKFMPPRKKPRMSDKILMQALLDHNKDVVMKIGTTESIKNEWDIYAQLKSYKIPGVLKYYCYFHCEEKFKSIPDKPVSICTGPGDTLKVLLLDFGIHNLSDFPWKTTQQLQSCVHQSLLTVLQAYISFGFCHDDCHPRNFIIKKSNKQERTYTLGKTSIHVPLQGYETFMMDLEGSKQQQPVKQLYKDLWVFCNDIAKQMLDKINAQQLSQYTSALYDMMFSRPELNEKQTETIINMIHSISQSIILIRPNMEGGRYKLPWRKHKQK